MVKHRLPRDVLESPPEVLLTDDEDSMVVGRLINFVLNDDIPCTETPEENELLNSCDLSESEFKEMESVICSVLNSFEDEPIMQEGFPPADSDSSIPKSQHLCLSPGSDVTGDPESSSAVQGDHDYFSNADLTLLESVITKIAGEGVPAACGTEMSLESTSETLEQSLSFPVAAGVDAEPQLVPQAVTQCTMPELILRDEDMEIMDDCSSPLACPPQTKAENGPGEKSHGKIKNKKSAKAGCCKTFYRMEACMARNQELRNNTQLLQKENLSLQKQLQELQASVEQSSTKTSRPRACTRIVALSFHVILPLKCTQDRGSQTVLTVRINESLNEVALNVPEDALLVLNLKPENPLVLSRLTRLGEEGQSPSNPTHSVCCSGNSCVISLGLPQHLELCSQGTPLPAGELEAWKAAKQALVKNGAGVVIQQHRAGEM